MSTTTTNAMTRNDQRNRRLGAASLALALALPLPACSGMGDRGTKEVVGGLVGAGAGAAVGSQIGGGRGKLAAVAVGTLAGALVGSSIGRSLDHADESHMQSSARRALDDGTTSSWENTATGSSGTISPGDTYQAADGRTCREYTQQVVVNGEPVQAHGTACREPDGTWKIVG